MDVPVAICPVQGVVRTPFQMAAHKDDALSSHIVDAISEDMCAVCGASTAVRCCDSLQGGDGSCFAVRVDPREVGVQNTC